MSTIAIKDDLITLEYNLYDLPTAQHKAGLAGLLLIINSLESRKIQPAPEVEITATTARIIFSKESLQSILDDLYDSVWVETKVKQKWKKKPKRIEEKEVVIDGKKKIEKRFVYDVVQPKGAFLQSYYSDDDGVWLKLWRDMLWTTLRGIPTTRNVYKQRANGKNSSETAKIWQFWKKTHAEVKKGAFLSQSLSSSIFIGAEAMNPEKVPFKGTHPDTFLLYFWPLASLIFVPRSLSIKRTDDQIKIERKESGYVLAVPEPSDLEAFVEDIVDVLKSMDTTKLGFRPRSALIDLFEESALESLYYFTRKKLDRTGQITFSLHAIEIYHLQKQGNRIRQLAVDRVKPDFNIINDYETMRDSYKNPFYKKIYLKNLLDGTPWHRGADAVFYHHPAPIFIYSVKTPQRMRFFGDDVRQKFNAITRSLKIKKGGMLMSAKDHEDQLSLRVYRLVQTYIRFRTQDKSGKKYDDFKNNKNEKGYVVYPKAYRETLEKVCSDAFLAMRGRRDHDFVEYFTGTICSVPQFLPETEYLTVAKLLMNDWQKVKTLSMLAISASSYLYVPSTQKKE